MLSVPYSLLISITLGEIHHFVVFHKSEILKPALVHHSLQKFMAQNTNILDL